MTLRAWCSGFPYPSPPLNHGSITPLQVPQRPIPSYSTSMQRHMLFWRLNWNFIYTRISDAEGSWTWSVESMHDGGIAWLGVEVVRRIILKQRVWAVFNHPSLLFILVQGFFLSRFFGLVTVRLQFKRGHYMWSLFRHLLIRSRFLRSFTDRLRLCSRIILPD